jgi:hypothetical protein
MLFMLFKNFMWAAWWPYYTMLLALEKAANQAAPNRPKSPPQPPQAPPQPPSRQAPRPEPQAPDTRVVRHEESRENSMTANDAFMKPEQVMRELMKLSIEQAKRAFETFVTTSEKTWKSLENASPSARASLYALNAKIAEITRMNAEANFAFAMRLAESRDVTQALEMQNEHVKKQMETFVRQLEEMRDLTAAIVQDANPARDVSKPGAARSAGSSSSYAPSSSFTPGETGRTY